MNRNILIVSVAILFILTGIVFAKSLKIFNPEMEPEAGKWDAPAHRVGEPPKEVWSATTLGAAKKEKKGDKEVPKPLEAKVVTRVGEIIDVSCYNQLGKHGKEHAGCAKACILNGAPMGILEADGTVYLLMPEEHDPRRDGKTALKEALINHVAQIVEVTGTYTNVKGMKAIYVHGFVKKD